MFRKKVLVLSILLTLLVCFSACSKSEPAEETEEPQTTAEEVSEEPQTTAEEVNEEPQTTAEEVNEEPQTAAEVNEEPEGITYEDSIKYENIFEVGENYYTREYLKIRKEPSIDSECISADEISDEDKNNVETDGDVVLKAGSLVKCVEVKDKWMKIPSGWICIEEPGEYQYVVFANHNESLQNNKDSLSNAVDGTKKYKTGIKGRYLVENKDNPNLDTAVLYEDGECLMRYKQAFTPVTDANGYTTGWYIVKGDKIYIQFGGSVYGYECYADGDKLVFTENKQIDTMMN